MFNEDKTIAAAQKVMLEILQEIHKICVENNLTYWLEAGTLLGAVRHKGLFLGMMIVMYLCLEQITRNF